MRLDFNVLWVEDQKDYVQDQRQRIEFLIGKEGFRLRVLFAASVAEATKYLSEDIYGDHVDLILMDYDLGAGDKGDEGIDQVRKIFPYKDIVFYSSQAPDLPEMVAGKKIQGVFCSTRVELPDTVDGVFEALVKKVLDIEHSRGIVMGATSDIDQYVNDCLLKIFNRSNDECRQKTLTALAKHMREKRKNFDKEATYIEAIKHVSELFSKHNVYTSNDRLRLLKNAMETDGKLSEKVDVIKNYLKETVPRRNILAHVKVEVEGFSRKLIDNGGNEFTSEQMKDLRHELLQYQNFMEKLAADLNAT